MKFTPEPGPRSFEELLTNFATDAQCRDWLCRLRWPDGFRCPKCGATKYWPVRDKLWECAQCRVQTSVTSGTLFENTRTPLKTWFLAMWWFLMQKEGASAVRLKQIFGLRSYEAAWTWMHKFRYTMHIATRDRLQGKVELTTRCLDMPLGPAPLGSRPEALIVVIAVQINNGNAQEIRVQRLPDDSMQAVTGFVTRAISPESVIFTEPSTAHDSLPGIGYRHTVVVPDPGEPGILANSDRVFDLLRQWIKGAERRSMNEKYLPAYLDEFAFRFNTRAFREPGQSFNLLIRNALLAGPLPYSALVEDPAELRRSASSPE